MKKHNFKASILTVFLLILLVAALAVSMISCDKNGSEQASDDTTAESVTEAVGTEIGEGENSFTFKVKFSDGSERTYLVNTDGTNVGQALIDSGLIQGDEGQYGLYVKTVAGETLDYNTHGKYWAFYENDSYALTGVELTTIEDGVVYSFIAT